MLGYTSNGCHPCHNLKSRPLWKLKWLHFSSLNFRCVSVAFRHNFWKFVKADGWFWLRYTMNLRWFFLRVNEAENILPPCTKYPPSVHEIVKIEKYCNGLYCRDREVLFTKQAKHSQFQSKMFDETKIPTVSRKLVLSMFLRLEIWSIQFPWVFGRGHYVLCPSL